MRPVIGITAWRRYLPTFLGEQTDLYTLGAEYIDAVHRAGGAALIIPRGPDAASVLDAVDGLLLSGGDDVHPESYGDAPGDDVIGADIETDRWEIGLVREAARRTMPTLAICRGMQVMSVAFGGKLVQHLVDVEAHPDVHFMSPEEILAFRHPVLLEPACTLARVYGETQKQINTIHHQAVVDAGELEVVGRGPGSVIEAVQPTNGWDAIGIQWHPEKMREDPLEARLFEHFVGQAKAYRAQKTREVVGGRP